MKLSVELYTIAEKFGDFKAAEMAKAAGFDAIDYSYYYNKACEEILGDGYKEYAEKLRAHLDKIGLSCNQAHAPFPVFYEMEYSEADNRYLWLIHSLESAAILGAKNIIVHPVGAPEGVDYQQTNIEFYKSLVPYCEKFDINVAIENVCYNEDRKWLIGRMGNPEEINDIVEKINSPRIVVCVDVGHAALTGFEPEDFIEGVKPGSLKALHIQDNDYLKDSHILPYTGKLNWEAIMRSLKKTEYDGDLTFEIVKYLEKFPNELFPSVLEFAVLVGRHLISVYNNS